MELKTRVGSRRGSMKIKGKKKFGQKEEVNQWLRENKKGKGLDNFICMKREEES